MRELTIRQSLDQGVALQTAGALDQARAIFNDVLAQEPSNAAAHYSLSAIEAGEGHHLQALQHIRQVIAARPKFAPAYLALSIILFHLKKLDEAQVAAETALSIDPHLADAKQHLQSIEVFKGLQNQNTVGAAEEHTGTQLQRLYDEGALHQSAARHAEAISAFQKALQIDPDSFVAWYSLGLAYSNTGRVLQAIECFQHVVRLKPDLSLGQFALGKTLQDAGLADAALACYDKAIACDPHYMDAYNNKAALLQTINRHHDALTTLLDANKINPEHVKTLEGQGILLTQFKKFDWASDAFQRGLKIDADYPYLAGNLMSARLYGCDWSEYEPARQQIIDGIRQGKRVCSPHTIMSLTDDLNIIQRCIEIYTKDKFSPSPFTLWNGEKYHHGKKRVAFISGDFRNHPVGYLLIGLIEHLDKRRFEVTAVFTGASDDSDLWRRYRCAVDHYINAQGKPGLEIAKLMRAMEIDVVIDLSGHTEGSRLDVLSHRPAPVQMTYLGFPGTLCLPFVDYLIADRLTAPESAQEHYAEKILYLPSCYLPRDPSVTPSAQRLQRSAHGLPKNAIVFCSFNHHYKIGPKMFATWMSLLKAVPDSVLWLAKLNEDADKRILACAETHGVSSERIVFATRVPSVEVHLARYRLADVFLDTFPYTGHTTVGDALLAGLPTVTMHGQSFASRVALSLFNDLGITTGACDNYDDYYASALALATDKKLRQKIKNQLKSKLTSKSWPIPVDQQADALMAVLDQAVPI